MVDYKTVHGMFGGLFAPLRSEEDRRARRLSDEAVQSYRERGFVRGPRVLDDDQIGALRDALEAMRTGRNPRMGELYEVDAAYVKDPERHVFHFLGAWMIDEFFHDILFHPAVTIPASQLLDSPRVRLWHDQVFYKPPRHPGVVAWHQDYSYWTRSTPPRHLTCWIGLDDSTIESGCVHFIPGSHRWNLLPKLSLLTDMDAVKEILTPEQKEAFVPEPMVLKAGECSFHDCMTIHGSYGNRADHPRRAIVLNFMHPETRSADGTKPLLEHTPIVPEGEIIEGVHYPIVYDAEAPLGAS
jgi:ectoine hydroxylase-related dioxygenase (phytanoyl-CoA dioxygenase family)